MNTWDEPLEALIWHWGDAYHISNPGLGIWIGERRDTHDKLRSDTPLGLRDKIVADYTARKVPGPASSRCPSGWRASGRTRAAGPRCR